MNCKEVKNNLIFYHYGELDKEQAQAIREHLAVCKTCARDYAKLSTVLNYAQAEAQTEPNPFIWTRIKAKLDKSAEYQPVPGWAKALQPVLLVALVVVGLFLGIQLGKMYTQPASYKTVAYELPDEQSLFISYNELDNTYLITDVDNNN